MNPEYLNAAVTLIVGLVALAVYALTKRSERQNAAMIILMDIRHAEQVVLSILEKGLVDRTMRPILSENNWGKYKHLFAKRFSSDDFAAFNRFFDACVEIEDARRKMVDLFYSNLLAKAAISQERMLDLADPVRDAAKSNRTELINIINSENYVYEPQEPLVRILKALQLVGRLSNSVAFEKLKKSSGVNA
jgi:hypothetical protein